MRFRRNVIKNKRYQYYNSSYRYEVDIDDCIYQAMLIKKDIENNKWSGPVMGEEFKIF